MFKVYGLAVLERDPLGRQGRGVDELDGQAIGDVRALLRRRAPAETAKASARSPTPARAAEKPFEYVPEIGPAILALKPAPLPRTAAKAPRPAPPPAEGRGRIPLPADPAPLEAVRLVLVPNPPH